MSIEQLAETARAMVAPGKGIIAIDESSATCKKRFEGVGIECTEDTRRAYRELLLTAPGANSTCPARSCLTKPSANQPRVGCRLPSTCWTTA